MNAPAQVPVVPEKSHEQIVFERTKRFDATFDVQNDGGATVGTGGRIRDGQKIIVDVVGWKPSVGEEYAVLAMLGELGLRVRWTWHDTTQARSD